MRTLNRYYLTRNKFREVVNPVKIFGSDLWFWGDCQQEGFADNSAVDTWTDWGNRKNHFTQGTGSAKPTFKKNGLNGYPSILFDGGDYLIGPSGVLGCMRNCNQGTLMVVGAWPTLVAAFQQFVFVSVGTTGNSDRCSIRAEQSGSPGLNIRSCRLDADAQVDLITTNLTSGSPYIITATFNWGANTKRANVNGAPQTAGSAGAASGATSNTDSVAVRIGSTGFPNQFFTSHIGSVLIIRGIPSTNLLAAVWRYLAKKWGINIGTIST